MWNIFKKPNYLLLGATTLAFGTNGHAADILPDSSSTMSDVVIPSATPEPYEADDTFTIHFYAKCYGTNLRGVANPLSRNGIVKATVNLEGETETFDIPANQIANQPRLFTKVMNLRRWIAIDASGNIKKYKSASLSDADEIKLNDPLPPATFKYVQANASNAGSYYGANATLTTHSSYSENQVGSVATVHVAFPGENGYCGGYYSPLMVFFDDDRPTFTANSDFPLNGEASLSFWPEKDAPGYFLALDNNDDGMITRADELFGNNQDIQSNGFIALSAHDSNKDGVIDFKDPVFNKLVLWKDANADGISQAEELQPLSEKKIQYLSLRYNDIEVDNISARAQLRERALFTFKDQTGQIKAGEVVDVWFSPYFPDTGLSLVDK